MLGRREVIGLLGGAAWPVAAEAQQSGRMRRVGLLTGFSEAEMLPLATVFRRRLEQAGWTDGRNVVVEVRAANGDFERLVADAGELVAAAPDVIVATGTPGVTAVQKHSRTIPVVFTNVADPERQGFIENLARPGGQLTGFTNFEFSTGGKWVELLKEVRPDLKAAVLLTNPQNPNYINFIQAISNAGRLTGIQISAALVRNPVEIEAAFESAAKQNGTAMIVFPDSLPIVHRDLIIGLADRHRLVTVYPFRVFPANGGLMSYGIDYIDVYRQAAEYVDRILRGDRPAELPVQAPNKFELIINLKTAKALGLEVPPMLLARADEVIE